MRASSLSNSKVIDLLNHYFVPVHADGVYITKNPHVTGEEKAAYEGIFQAFHSSTRRIAPAANQSCRSAAFTPTSWARTAAPSIPCTLPRQAHRRDGSHRPTGRTAVEWVETASRQAEE